MGDWRLNKDEEVALDGVGGVNILVKADVHRSGESSLMPGLLSLAKAKCTTTRHQLPLLPL